MATPSSTGARTDDVGAAIRASHLRDLPPALLHELLADAARITVPSGGAVRRAGERGPHLELVLHGLLRISLSSVDGRSITVRYCRPGALMGVVSLFTEEYEMPGTITALVDSELLLLRPAAVARLARRDLPLANAMLDELSDRVLSFVWEIPGNAFATVRQRVARHLLDLASEAQHEGGALVADLSQQDLADAVGTVREVIVRVLRDLRTEGIVRTTRAGIVIVAPERLSVDLYPGRQV